MDKEFNWKQYILNYPDLQAAGINTQYLALKHYRIYGKKEGRSDKIGLQKIVVTEVNKGFNWKQYISNYPDLQAAGINTEYLALKHYRLYGKKEGRIDQNISEDSFFKEIQNINKIVPTKFNNIKKTLIIYTFYELNEYVKYVLNNAFFYHKNYKFVIVINNPTLKIDVPIYVDVVNRDNVNFDFGAYSYYLNHNKYDIYDQFLFFNASLIGPFVPNGYTKPWTDIFLDKLTNDVKLVGISINIQISIHVQSMLFCFSLETLKLLIKNGIFSNNVVYYNLNDVVINKEVKMSTIILNNKGNIACIIKKYNGIDFRNTKNHLQLPGENITMNWFKYFKSPTDTIFLKWNKLEKPFLKKITANQYNYNKLFHKYYLNLKNPDDNIKYNIVYSNIDKNVKKLLCIHCYDFSNLIVYFNDLIQEYNRKYTIIITFSINSLNKPFDNEYYNSVVILKIKNKGVDIGSKLTIMQYLKDINLNYDFALFVHSKSNDTDRNNLIKPFLNRSNLLEYIFENNIDCIFPDYMNIYTNQTINKQCMDGLEDYYKEFSLFFNITPSKELIFNAVNFFALSKKFIDLFSTKLKFLYNNLNEDNDFDYNWHRIYYNLKDLSIEENYNIYVKNKNFGNDWSLKDKGIRNGCYEHIFERMWIHILKSYNCNFISLPMGTIKSFYKIKVNAIYFPQFHNSEENNKYWGEGFTEWTLLKPFPDTIKVRGNNINIMKPHDDIGFYSLDNVSTFNKQIDIAKKYNIDGFVIYHYWFGNNRSVLNKVEKHILNGYCNFPFCFSWANEPWTNQWEGSSNDKMLIEQTYEESTEHIEYLLQFFKNPYYMKNKNNECIFYIYNYEHIKEKFNKIIELWLKISRQNGIKIKFITTINANPYNKVHGTETKYLFSPVCHTKIWKSFPGSDLLSNGSFIKKLPYHFEINYDEIIEDYKTIDINNLHCGLPLNWNNIMRKKDKPHLHINNFNNENLEKMLNVIVSKIISKYKNKLSLNPIEKYNVKSVNIEANNFNFNNNIIIINAWNEWNEQAILEPNNITGYTNLETINGFFEKL